MSKLSPTQIEVLRRMAEPGNCAHWMGGISPYWFIASTVRTVRCATMEKLILHKLVKEKKDTLGYLDEAHITNMGRATLSELEKKS